MESALDLGYNETCLQSCVVEDKDKEEGDSGLSSSSSPTRAVKKQTRRWAAWTRQEEECFFNALKQVGKNFEMITCRVQSKNKDQVRHYYYRLVRRMNKLLGPEFSLDAKNSKDTNAAMLRWWSLLEKYSCKASKLHLKPRRFKIFIEALERQLLKDRKKNLKKLRKRSSPNDNGSSPVFIEALEHELLKDRKKNLKKLRKRSSHNDNGSPLSLGTNHSQSKVSGHDTRSVKEVIVNNQNIQKLASSKGSLVKRNMSNSLNRGNSKVDLSTVKTRQQRKPGGASSAAYKRWEKAAIAGVSLVADAAEHLERTTINKDVSANSTLDDPFPSALVPTKAPDVMLQGACVKNLPHLSIPTSSQHHVTEISTQISIKLKLQLFPIDEATRTALMKEDHNPYLELTLSARKKITSILEHLNRKWGKSSVAVGELVLFPYSAQRENIVSYQRWTQETIASAADVYASIGSSNVFRLRYGWFPSADLVSSRSSLGLHSQEESMGLNFWRSKNQHMNPSSPVPGQHSSPDTENLIEPFRDQPTSVMEDTDPIPSFTDDRDDMTSYVLSGVGSEKSQLPSTEHLPNSLLLRKRSGEAIIKKKWEDVDNLRTSNDVSLSAGDWADSLTNISVGELLTEASRMELDGSGVPTVENPQFLQHIPFSCDSFDAAIAAHIAGRQDKSYLSSVQLSHDSSIWDAEETCDAFSFRKIPPPNQDGGPNSSRNSCLETCKQIASKSSTCFKSFIEEFPKTRTTEDIVCDGATVDNFDYNANKLDDSTKDVGLADTYWTDSLGPLDLDITSTRYQGQDLMYSDSLSGLNRLIANSLDAFQNCSFFGLDKTSMNESREAASLLDRKIGGEV